MASYIIGISAYYHDSAASILCNGKIIAAAQEERFTRIKHDDRFPHHALKYCMREAGCLPSEVEAIVFYDKPFLKFERLLETYYAFAPKGLVSFIKAIPVWIKEKLYLKKKIKDEFKLVGDFDFNRTKLLFPEHHLSHAASAYYPSRFNNAAIITLDGVGEWASAAIFKAEEESITVLKQLNFPHSIGLLYSSFTYYLGFKVNSGEYKLMGLAPYGIEGSTRVKRYIEIIKSKLVEIKDDGSIRMNQKYFSYATGSRMLPDKEWEKLFEIPKRTSESSFEQVHCDLALAIQKVTEEIVLKIVDEAKRLTKLDNLCLAGGVALNCVSNGKILKQGLFKNVYIQPAAGDAGGAIGAALAAEHIYFDRARIAIPEADKDNLQGSYLGPRYSDLDVEYMAKAKKAKYNLYPSFNALSKDIAKEISEGKIVGWFQGRMEFGPRALGNRSILGDPRNPEMQLKLNMKIKYRESFRPFAPSVLEEDVQEFFELETDSPYMLLVSNLSERQLKELPQEYNDLPMRDKLYVQRSTLPAVTHVDLSARIQTVHKNTNPKYHQLISDFKAITGVGVLVNTSFNVRGEPIVCTPENAFDCFINTEMDILVINNYVFSKEDQLSVKKNDHYLEQFSLD